MAHADWLEKCAPKECWRCAEEEGTNCKLDMSMPCSPDCEFIDAETGEPMLGEGCDGCDAGEVWKEQYLDLDERRHR